MKSLILQGVRFLGIGFLNTAVDFAVLNFLASSFEIYKGVGAGILNVISFAVAVLHSFFWNKFWAFASTTQEKLLENFWKFAAAATLGVAVLVLVIGGSRFEAQAFYYLILLVFLGAGELVLWKLFRLKVTGKIYHGDSHFFLFIAVTVLGALINSGIVVLVTSQISPLFGLNKEAWLNAAKAGATAVSLVWNFAGYKVFVFRR